jgi:adenine-specific DNA methylase
VLDVFGGTGAVSHIFKNAGKQVIYNDALSFNHWIGLALIENRSVTLDQSDIDRLVTPQLYVTYPHFIEETFGGIYYTNEENAWLDRLTYNIQHLLSNPFQQAMAYFALFQACIIKRPYNLFHRANLYMRVAQVERSFGNKSTWDTPFETHFRNFVAEANQSVFDNGESNRALCQEAMDTPVGADLVYLDPPYLNHKGQGVDYRDFYHFLEGLADEVSWSERIDYQSKHRRLKPEKSPWTNAATIPQAFEQLLDRHRNSILVVSYRDDGIPSKGQLIEMMRRYKPTVYQASLPMQYALAHKKSQELLLIGI